MRNICRYIPILLLPLLFSSCVSTGTSPKTLARKIAEDQGPAILNITTYDQNDEFNSYGTGFFISSNGVIATNNHLLENGYKGIIKTADEKTYKDIMILDYDEAKDVAILKVDANNTPFIKIGDPDSVKQGDKVITIGNPSGFQSTVSDGIVSAIRDIDNFKIFQITCPISGGSSGGPLLNSKGEAIGITSAYMESGQNLNFAISIEALNSLYKNKKKLTITERTIKEKDKLQKEYLDKQKESDDLDPEDCLFEKACNLLKQAEEKTSYGYLEYGTDNQDAIKLLRDALLINPDYHAAIFYLGQSLSEIGNYTEAEELLSKAIEIKPLYVKGIISFAYFLKEQKKYQKSLEHFDRALKLEKNSETALLGKSRVYYDLEDYNNAEKYFRIFEKNDKKNIQKDFLLSYSGALKLHRGNLVSAWKDVLDIEYIFISEYVDDIKEMCIPKLGENNYYAYSILGQLEAPKISAEQNIDYLLKAEQLNPKEFLQYYEIGEYYFKLYNYKEALKYFLKAEKINRRKFKLYKKIGEIYTGKKALVEPENIVPKDCCKAIQYFEKAKKLNPSDEGVILDIAICKYDQKLYYEALSVIENINSIGSLKLKATIYEELKKYDLAIRYYNELIEKDNNVFYRNQIALMMFENNQKKESIEYLEKIILDNTFKEDWEKNSLNYNLAILYKKSEKYERAKDLFMNVKTQSPNYFLIDFEIASCFFDLKKYTQAIDWYKIYINKYGDDFAANYNLALCYFNINDYSESLKWFKKANELKKDKDAQWFIKLSNDRIELQNYPKLLEQESEKNDNSGTLAKILILYNDYDKINDTWIQGINETKYEDGQNIVSPKVFESKALADILLKKAKNISSRNISFKNIIDNIIIALEGRIDGFELTSKGYYTKRKDYQGEFERGKAKINIADTYIVQALQDTKNLLSKYNLNCKKAALTKINFSIEYYNK